MTRTSCDRPAAGARPGGAARRFTAGLLLVAVIGAPIPAWALQGGEDPSQLPVLIDKRYGGEGRHQFSVMFTTSLVSKFTEGLGVFATYQYSFTDVIGIELGGGFWDTRENSIVQQVRLDDRAPPPLLSDLYAMQWTATANIVIVPLYGKISFASEFDPAFDLFLLAGGGVVGTRRGTEASLANGEPAEFESSLTYGFDVGGGFRFYLLRVLALRVELRNWFYPEQANFNSPSGREIGGVTSVLNLQVGVQFAFGG